MHYILVILITLTINTAYSAANSISYFNFECNGVLRTTDVTTIAKWNINFINSNRATLDLFYDNKKRSADLRISIQKNQDFYANGKWRSQTSQGGRFVRLKYINSSMKLTLGPNGNNSLRVDGKCLKKEVSLKVPKSKIPLKKIKDIVFIIKEHSKYSINHPYDTDNILRHLKHTCHAIDSSLVEERPMPAGEESLSDLLLHSDKQDLDGNELLKAIKSVSNSSKDMCKKYLYSWEKSQELLETARYINFNFEKLYNELND
ncbi:MAG: hypothetical protein VB916_04415 [Alphaproteobacteria bacterium]